jgi:hypothetical protein
MSPSRGTCSQRLAQSVPPISRYGDALRAKTTRKSIILMGHTQLIQSYRKELIVLA